MFKSEKKYHVFVLFTEIFVPLEENILKEKKNCVHDLTQDCYAFLGVAVKCEKHCFFPWLLTHVASRP